VRRVLIIRRLLLLSWGFVCPNYVFVHAVLLLAILIFSKMLEPFTYGLCIMIIDLNDQTKLVYYAVPSHLHPIPAGW
jgi:hypothetical protein